jgi:serine phosphatase RsbU (regulator of sigma subunit)
MIRIKSICIFGAIVLFTFSLFSLSAQVSKIDSLFTKLKSKKDTGQVNILNAISENYLNMYELDSALKYAKLANKLAEKHQFKKGIAKSFSCIGTIYDYSGDYKTAIKNYEISQQLYTGIGDKRNVANLHNCMGTVYLNQSDYAQSLEHHTKALALRKETNDKKGVAGSLNNIGNIYLAQGNYPIALQNYFNALKINEEMGNKKWKAINLQNIGLIYDGMNDKPKALEYLYWSLKLREELNDLPGKAQTLHNLSNIYIQQKDYSKAMELCSKALKINEETNNIYSTAGTVSTLATIYYFQAYSQKNPDSVKAYKFKALETFTKSLKMNMQIGNKELIALCYINIGMIQTGLKKLEEAEENLNKGLTLSKEMNIKDRLMDSYKGLSTLDSMKGNWKSALTNYKMSVLYKDSLMNESNTKKGVQAEMNFEFEKKQQAAFLEQQKKDAIIKEEEDRQKVIRNSFIAGSGLLLMFVLIIFRSYRQKRKANVIITQQKSEVEKAYTLIESQKIIVEEKHKEITDSINYAERIQRSFLATKELLDENLKEYFVFFQPKESVSGDFYWASKSTNGRFLLVTADSTGHGVPGAIMSILNISCIEHAVEEKKLSEPAEILNETRARIIARLKKDGSEEGGKDGMDCSLINVDYKNLTLSYAAANNPVWIVRNKEILELAPDKMPVGKHDKDAISFTQNTVELKMGDMVYTFTDGMPDQFGGPKGKKFLYKQFKELLISVANLPASKQKEIINNSLNKWKGELEQIDDICVIGIRIS